MHARNALRFVTVAVLALAAPAFIRPASASQFTIGFEDASNIPNDPGPSPNNISNTFSDAYVGDTVDGVIFSDDFSVYRNTYTNDVGGTDFYGATDGNFALTNTAGGGDADTGPGDAGLDGLTFLTPDTLQGVSFAANDYGNGSFGADQVTVTAFNNSGDLASATLALADGLGNPITALTFLDTSSEFDPFAGDITGYRINRELSPPYADLGSGGGNYVADDFVFDTPTASSVVPEPSPIAVIFIGVCGVLGLMQVRRARIRLENLKNTAR